MDENQLPFPLLVATLFAIAGSISVWWLIFCRLRAGEAILPHEPRRPVPWNAGHVIAIILLYVATQIAVGMVVLAISDVGAPAAEAETLLDDEGAIPPDKLAPVLLSNAVANLIVVGLTMALLGLAVGATSRDWGFLPWRPISDIPLGLVAFLASLLPVYAIQLVLTQFFPSEHPVQQLLTSDSSSGMLLLAGFSAVVVAPVAEEFLFRGILQGWLEAAVASLAWPETSEPTLVEPPAESLPAELADQRALHEDAATSQSARALAAAEANPYQSPETAPDRLDAAAAAGQSPTGLQRWLPIGVSSFLFAIVHLGHGPDPIPLFVLAVILGYLYQQTHRLWPCIVLHMCLNAASLMMLWASL